MRNILFLGLSAVMMLAVTACGNKQKRDNVKQDYIKVSVADTAFYGTLAKGTSMHSLEVTDENGNTTTYLIDETTDNPSSINTQPSSLTTQPSTLIGGIFSGDRVTLTACKNAEGEMRVTKLINLTSLCGKWTSLDRNFEIKDDGSVESHQTGETHPYTQWSMVNCNLVLNIDTFAIDYIGPDSLTLENKQGIYVYRRLK